MPQACGTALFLCCLRLSIIWLLRSEYRMRFFQLSQVEYLIDIQVFSSFCVDRKKKQERTANTLPPSNKWAFRCLAAELAASPLRQSSPETTPKSLICYRRLPLSFAQLTPRHLSWQTCEMVLIMISSSFRIGLNLRDLNRNLGFRLPFLAMAMLKRAWHFFDEIGQEKQAIRPFVRYSIHGLMRFWCFVEKCLE